MKTTHQIKSSGFSLIETMIAIVVLSSGLFGLLGLIINSLKLSSTSNYRTLAAQQAYIMADSLRGMPAALIPDTNGLAGFSSPTPAPTASCLLAAGCGRTQFVNNAVSLWQQQLLSTLPQGFGKICQHSTPPVAPPTFTCDGSGPFIVTVCWDESHTDASKAQRTTVGAAQYICTWASV